MPAEPKMPKVELSPSVSIIVAGVLIAGAIVFVNRYPAAQPVDAANGVAGAVATADVPAPSASDHIQGSLNAPIVLIEYSDFQCPYCQMIYPTLKQVVAQSNGSIAWVMREYPLYQIHPLAMPAANAAECIADQLGNTGFWKYADTIFNNQSQLSAQYSASLAQQFGANITTYTKCVTDQKFLSKMQTETSDAQGSGGNGTPFTVVYNTQTHKQYPISGALPAAQIMAVIKAAQNSQ